MKKYCDSGIPHNWDVSFGKFGGLPTLEGWPENLLARQKHLIVISMNTNEFAEVPHTIGCNISQAMGC